MKRVIIVDDTKNIRNLLSTCLQLEGYKIIEAKNGLEALNLIKDNHIDLAFIDVKMPGVSGTELLKKIRAMGKDFVVVIMTAFPTIKNAVDCTKLGAVAYLQKPFTAERIKNLLKEIHRDLAETKDVWDYIRIAKEFMDKSQLDEALTALKKALSVDPRCGEAYYIMSEIYKIKGDVTEGDKFYKVSKLFKES